MKSKIIFILVVTLLIFKSVEIKSQSMFDTLPYISYPINVKYVYYSCDNTMYPLTLYVKPYGYWNYNDINYGHAVTSEYRTRRLWPDDKIYKEAAEKKVYVKLEYIYDTLNIDTLNSYFDCNDRKSDIIVRKAPIRALDLNYMFSDFQYSYILSNANIPKIYGKQQKELRMLELVCTGKYSPIDLCNLVGFRFFENGSVMIYLTKIDISNLQDVNIIKQDSTWLSKIEIKRLKKTLSLTNFNFNLCRNSSYKQDLLLENKNDNLLEYNNNFNYCSYFLDYNNVSYGKKFHRLLNLSYLLNMYKKKYFKEK